MMKNALIGFMKNKGKLLKVDVTYTGFWIILTWTDYSSLDSGTLEFSLFKCILLFYQEELLGQRRRAKSYRSFRLAMKNFRQCLMLRRMSGTSWKLIWRPAKENFRKVSHANRHLRKSTSSRGRRIRNLSRSSASSRTKLSRCRW